MQINDWLIDWLIDWFADQVSPKDDEDVERLNQLC